jgi:hypothetical protein
MSIPNEIKIGILGAGGKMGMRIGANLKKLSKLSSQFFCLDQTRHPMQP